MQPVKDLLIKRLSQVVTSVCPNFEVNLYGSHATELCLHWSDIDLVIGPSQADQEKDMHGHAMLETKIYEALRKVSEGLRNEIAKGWVVNVHYVDGATVPVIKLQCSLKSLMTDAGLSYPKNPKYAQIYENLFSVDITHMTEFHNGLACVQLVKDYILESWFIEPLLLVLK